MATEKQVKGPASYFPSIETKYGFPIKHWLDLLVTQDELKHMEMVAWLKSEHGLGHGHANALVAYFRSQNSA
jgi:monomeric isocitrate dehydrogenase